MLGVVILLYLNLVVFKSEDSRLVIIYIAIVGCTEYGNDRGEFSGPIPLMQLVAVHLDLVCAYHT